jgi:hypothetical protein
MAIGHNNSVVTDGLVIYHDLANTQKSWRGQPTTNYISFPDASWNGSSFVNFGYNYANLGVTYTYGAGVSNPINAAGVLQYFTGTTGYKYFSVDSTSLPVTGTYTFSYYARMRTAAAANNIGNSQLWRAAGSDRAVTGDWNPTFTSEWVRYSTTGPAEAGTILQYFPVHSGSITGGYTIEYCGFQLEVGSYATPYVEGTRSNSQAIVDLTSTNTITATSLTYASNNVVSFNGTVNYLTVSSFVNKPTAAITCEAWIRPTKASVGTGLHRGGVISCTNTTYLGLIDSNDGGTTFSLHWANQTSISRNGGANGNIPNNQWSHIVGTYDGTRCKGYVNGVVVYDVAQTGTIPDGTWVIGTYGAGLTDGVHNFNGSIPVARIYNRALSADEVRRNFAGSAGRFGL